MKEVEAQRRCASQLWSLEIIFNSPEPGQEGMTKKFEIHNRFNHEFKSLRETLFSSGLAYPVDARKYIIIPPANLVLITATLQRGYYEG